LLLDEKSIQLSQRENAIFACLMRNIGRPVSKSKIEESIYDWSSEHIESNTVEVHIAALRRKLGRDVITTLRGIGYSIQ
jgi:DNA-binding response OmpR family regulator